MKFLRENDLNPSVGRGVAALVASEHDQVILLRDKFDQNIDDVSMINALAQEGGWALISGGRKQRRDEAERTALVDGKICAFYVPQIPTVRVRTRAIGLLNNWPEIRDLAEKPGCRFYRLTKNGKPKPFR